MKIAASVLHVSMQLLYSAVVHYQTFLYFLPVGALGFMVAG